MQTISVENDVNENFTLMRQNSQTYVDPSSDVFAASEISTSDRSESASKIENRYGAASKRWKTVVKNFMNAPERESEPPLFCSIGGGGGVMIR